MVGYLPVLVAQGHGDHVHEHSVPHAVDIRIVGGLSGGLVIAHDARDDGVLK